MAASVSGGCQEQELCPQTLAGHCLAFLTLPVCHSGDRADHTYPIVPPALPIVTPNRGRGPVPHSGGAQAPVCL